MSEASPVVPGARHTVVPKGIVATAWPKISQTCRNIGWRFDPWQDATGRLILAKRDSGKWAADLSILSIPRQVGKSYLLGCIIFALCLLNPRLRVIWTSHHTATTEEMYEAMKELASHKRVAPHVTKCVALQGSRWRIQFRNGSRIDFGARSQGFGRGKARVGVLVLDEFQHISARALANLAPTTNTADNPLILCAGTPPGPDANGEAFRLRRKAALEGISDDTLYVEFSADTGGDLDDRKQWAKANPSFPKRTKERAFLLLRKILEDDDFSREALGIWGETNTNPGDLDYAAWLNLADHAAERGAEPVFGVDVAEDRTASIAVLWRRDDGLVQAMLADEHLSPLQLEERLQKLRVNWGGRVATGGAAADVLADTVVNGVEFASACGRFADLLTDGGIRHGNQPTLNRAVEVARWRAYGSSGERAFRLKDAPEVGPLAAVTRALHELEHNEEPRIRSLD